LEESVIRRIPHAADVALLIARLAVGVVFVAHGWQKLVVFGHAGTVKAFDGMGVPLPSAAAFYSTWAELLGGVALILGVVTSAAGLLLFIDMLGAFVIVHVDHGVFASDGGFELVLTLGAISLGLALSGAGRFSVDNIALRRVTQRPAG